MLSESLEVHNRAHRTEQRHGRQSPSGDFGVATHQIKRLSFVTAASAATISSGEERYDVRYFPRVIRDSSRHCRSDPERLMDPTEVVVHEVECDGRF